jgi:hypothetical protein
MGKYFCDKGGLHDWDYTKWIHYKYRGPVNEYGKKCKKCGVFVELFPWAKEKYKFDERSREVQSKSSC